MNCKKCGFILTPADQFCKNCGEPVNAQPTPNMVNNGVDMNNPVQQPVQNPTPNVGMPTPSIQPDMTTPVQPMNNVQTPFPAPAPAPKKSNKALIFIILGVVVVGLVVAGVIFGPKLFGGSSNGGSGTEPTTNNGGGTTTPPSTTSYKVNYGGFDIKIPGDYVYKDNGTSLFIGDEQGTWGAYLTIGEGSYAQVKSNMATMQSFFQQKGYTASAAKTGTYGGSEFVTCEIVASGNSALIGYTKITSMHIAVIEAYDVSNEYNYDILEKLAPIISTAEASTSATSNMMPQLDLGAFEVVSLSE